MKLAIELIDYTPNPDVDWATVKDLSESIAEKGLLHPIAVQSLNGKNKLITGIKRLEAVKLLKWTEIECVLHDAMSDEDAQEIHIHENLKRGNLPWYEQVILTKDLHELRQRQKGKGRADAGPVKTGWGMRDTARELGTSLGTVSQDIDLAHAVLHDPSLKNIQDKRTAMRLIKQSTKRIEAEQMAGIKLVDTEENVVYLGRSAEILKHLPDSFIHAVITDPPWIDFREKRLTKDEDTWPVFKELYRVMKWDSFLYMFVGTDDFFEYRQELPTLGFSVQTFPLIWAKTGVLSYGVKPWEHQRNFELILLAVKGNPVLTSTTQQSAIFNYAVIPPVKLIHPNEKPPDLIKEIMLECTFDGAFIMDPFGGSGVTGEVARALGRRYILIEREKDIYDRIVKRLAQDEK